MMLGLLKKDLPVTALESVVMITMLYTYWFVASRPINVAMTILAGGYVFALIVGTMLINEYQEDKSNGYDFLRGLPLTVRDIVMAKFALPLFLAVVLIGFSAIIMTYLPGTDQSLAVARTYVLGIGLLGLICVGLAYNAAYAFDTAHYLRILLVTVILMVLVFPVLIIERFADGQSLAMLEDSLLNLNWPAAILLVIVAYYGLMLNAVRLKSAASSEN